MKNKEVIKKLYDIRMHMFNYEPFYSLLLANFPLNLISDDQKNKIFKNSEKVIVINNKICVDKDFYSKRSVIVLSIHFIKAIEKYLNKIYEDDALSKEKNKSDILMFENEDDDDIYDKELEDDEDNNGMNEEWKELLKIERMAYEDLKRAKLDKFIPDKIKERYEIRKEAKIDWREILRDYILEENADFSFNPPDRRYNDTNFYLPDYNLTDKKIEDIVFMIDTSGSMEKETIDQLISEVKNIVQQFKGEFHAYLGFFDTEVNDIKDIYDYTNFDDLIYEGRGGTSFIDIFDKVDKLYNIENVKALIILTDGMGTYPDKNIMEKYPLIWILCGKLCNSGFEPKVGRIIKYEC